MEGGGPFRDGATLEPTQGPQAHPYLSDTSPRYAGSQLSRPGMGEGAGGDRHTDAPLTSIYEPGVWTQETRAQTLEPLTAD